jgi:endoglucanase
MKKFNPIHQLVLTLVILILPGISLAQDRYRGMNVTDQLTASDVAVLESWNVNVVRFQLVLNAAENGSANDYLAELDSTLANLDTLLPILEQAGIKVILDLHTPPGGFASKNFPAQFKLFTQPDLQATLVTAWESIALRYLNNDVIYGFDILSEPATGSRRPSGEWLSLATDLAQAIWSIDSSRQLLIAPDYADPKKLKFFSKRLKKNLGSEDYSNKVIHNIHLFVPFKYVTQGVSRIVKKPVQYGTRKLNRRTILTSFRRLKKAQAATKARIFIGEFSVVRWAPRADRFLSDFVRLLEKNKWGWTYHIFREFDGWSVEHTEDQDNPNVSPTETRRLSVLKRFFARNG